MRTATGVLARRRAIDQPVLRDLTPGTRMLGGSVRKTVVAAAAFAALGAFSCDGEGGGGTKAPPGPVDRPGEPDFTWRAALERPRNAVEAAVGPADDCDPERQLPALRPEIHGFFPDDPRKCHFPEAEDNSDGAYYIDAILYSKKVPTAIILRPTEEMELSPDVLEKFYIRKPIVERRRVVEWGGTERRVLSYRVDVLRGKIDRTAPIAVDLVGRPDAPEKLDFVRIGVASGWPYSIDHVQLAGPPPVGDSTILPRTTLGAPLEYGMSLMIGVDQFSVRPQRRFPIRRNGDDREFTTLRFDNDILDGEATAEEDPWQAQVEEQVRRWIRGRRELGKVPKPVTYTIFPTQTTPFGRVARATAGLEEATESTFRTAGRFVDAYGVPFDRFARMRTLSTPFRPSVEAVSSEADSAPLVAEVTARGIDLRVDGTNLDSVRDCPASGPTFCLTEDVDVAETIEQARSLHRDGDWAESDQNVERALGAYDWHGLYNRLSELASDASARSTLAVTASRDLATAVPFRLLQLTRRRVTLPGEEGCLEQLPDDTSFADVRPCRTDDGDPSPVLIEEPVFIRPD